MKRWIVLLGVIGLVAAGCGKDNSGTASKGGVTIQVDDKSDAVNFEAIAYFPDKATVAPGTTVNFHGNFQGEFHTVTFGSSINKGLGIFDTLTDEQKQGPPPPEVEALKIPLVFPDNADFSDPASVKFNQSAAQPCYLKAGQFAPGAEPCPRTAKPKFDGSQPFYNSGILKNDETFSLDLADNIKPGTYRFFCLVHGPEMQGSITVADKGAQDAAAVAAAGKQALDEAVGKVQPDLDKARSDAKPGEVKAGVDNQEARASINEFVPKEISVAAGKPVTWNLSFHTVSFNAPEDARPYAVQDANGTWHINTKLFEPVGYTPPAPPAKSDSGPPAPGGPPPPPTNVDGGTWNGTGFYNSSSVNAPGDVFFTLVFSKPGTYKYTCLIHPDMEGTVKVT